MFQNENEFILISMQCCYCIAKPRHGNICKKKQYFINRYSDFHANWFLVPKRKITAAMQTVAICTK